MSDEGAINKYRVVLRESRTVTFNIEANDAYHAIKQAKINLLNGKTPIVDTFKIETKSVEEVE